MLDRMLAVISDPAPGQEDEYNRWYDAVHIPEALQIPGFRAARRFKMAIVADDPDHTLGASYLTLYDLDVDAATAVHNLAEARATGRMTPLSPAVATETLERVTYEGVTDWVRAAEGSAG